MTNIKRTRAVGILINKDKILLINRRKEGSEFWVFPGGGVDDGEKVEEAVVREIEEEASIESQVLKLLYKHIYPDIRHEHHFYLCKYISGEPELGEYNEMQTMEDSNQYYNPEWVRIDKLKGLLLYPLEIRDWFIKDIQTGFKETPRELILDSTTLRQEI